MDITAKYNFQKWIPEKKPSKNADRKGGLPSVYVRFTLTTMYLSTGFMNMLKGSRWQISRMNTTYTAKCLGAGQRTELRFDLLIDKQERIFVIKFHDKGEYAIKTIPCQVSMGRFIKEMKPVIRKAIPMTFHQDINGEEFWIGRLDGYGTN